MCLTLTYVDLRAFLETKIAAYAKLPASKRGAVVYRGNELPTVGAAPPDHRRTTSRPSETYIPTAP